MPSGRTGGRVLAFDIQPEAVEQTRALLEAEGLQAEVHLDSHAHMTGMPSRRQWTAWCSTSAGLPGGDPQIMTRADSSLAAIGAGLTLLKPGGVMAIALYYGGANGYEERDAVLAYVETLDPKRYTVLSCRWANRQGDPPLPVLIWKET